LSSCAGTKKIDFKTAYKFSRYNYNKAGVEETPHEQDARTGEKLYASNEVKMDDDQDERLARVEEKIYQKIGVSIEDGKSFNTHELAEGFKKLDRKEKKQIRKEIKSELKHLKHMEANDAYSIKDTDQINELTDYMRISIIVGSVGLVLLLIGALFSIGFLSIVGALAIVGAAVLFILDQV
jgi:hypothetical protein